MKPSEIRDIKKVCKYNEGRCFRCGFFRKDKCGNHYCLVGGPAPREWDLAVIRKVLKNELIKMKAEVALEDRK